jgi:tyrosinase
MEMNKIQTAKLEEKEQQESSNFGDLSSTNSIFSNRYIRTLTRQLPLNRFNLRTDSQIYPREDQAEMTESKKNNLVEALKALFNNGQYADLVSIHSDSRHKHHFSGETEDVPGRFLPWHRLFLYELENRLNSVSSTKDIRIPYWDWIKDRDIPELVIDLKPLFRSVPIFNVSQNKFFDENIQVRRRIGVYIDQNTHLPVELPNKDKVTELLNQPTFNDFNNYLNRSHNRVHMWVGGTTVNPPQSRDQLGTMSDPEVSPADPIFFLHHSNIDRLWDKWNENHTEKPDLKGQDAVMDPWPYDLSRDRIIDTKLFGYFYQ